MLPALFSFVLLPLLGAMLFFVIFGVRINRPAHSGQRTTMVFLTLVSLVIVAVRLAGGWDRSPGTILWVVLACSFVIFIVAGLMKSPQILRVFPALDPLMLGFAVLFSLLAVLSDWMTWSVGANQPLEYLDGMTQVHIAVSVSAYALAVLAAVAAVAVVLRVRALKQVSEQGSHPVIAQLPSLFEAEQILILMLKATAGVLLVGIVTGGYDSWQQTGDILTWTHKTILSLLSFFVVSLMLAVHSRVGIYGRRAVQGGILIFVMMSLSVPGVKVISWLLSGQF